MTSAAYSLGWQKNAWPAALAGRRFTQASDDAALVIVDLPLIAEPRRRVAQI